MQDAVKGLPRRKLLERFLDWLGGYRYVLCVGCGIWNYCYTRGGGLHCGACREPLPT